MNLKNKKFYRGNPNLLNAREKVSYTLEQAKEIEKCKNDIVYFASKYFYIVSIDHGKIIIPLTTYQKKLLRQLEKNRHNIILQSRQSFKCCAYTTNINIRNKKTGEIKTIPIGELYDKTKKLDKNA